LNKSRQQTTKHKQERKRFATKNIEVNNQQQLENVKSLLNAEKHEFQMLRSTYKLTQD